jgi:hypothetical protein
MIGVRDAGKGRRKGRDRLNDIGRNREVYRERDRGRNGGRDRGRDSPVVNTLGSPYSLVYLYRRVFLQTSFGQLPGSRL